MTNEKTLTIKYPAAGSEGTGNWAYRNEESGAWAQSFQFEKIAGRVDIDIEPLDVRIESTYRTEFAAIFDDDSTDLMVLLDRSGPADWDRVPVYLDEDGEITAQRPDARYRLKIEWPETELSAQYYCHSLGPGNRTGNFRFMPSAALWSENERDAIHYPTVAALKPLLERMEDETDPFTFGSNVVLTVERVEAAQWDD